MGQFTEEEQEKIIIWIDAGAPETVDGDTAAPTETAPTSTATTAPAAIATAPTVEDPNWEEKEKPNN